MEGCDSTTELLPPFRNSKIEIRKSPQRSSFFSFSESRVSIFDFRTWWTGEDSNLRRPHGPADLQSAAFDHSATCPVRLLLKRAGSPRAKSKEESLAASQQRTPVAFAEACVNHSGKIRDTSRAQCPRWFECRMNFKNLLPDLVVSARRRTVQRQSCARSHSAFAQARLPQPSWSWRRDSNPRPSDYKSDALPAELRQRSQTYNTTRAAPELQGPPKFFLRPSDRTRPPQV